MDETIANIRHERSKKDFPALKLEDGEYVEFALSRAKVCYILIWASVLGIAIVVAALFLFAITTQPAGTMDEMGRNFMWLMFATIIGVSIIAGLIVSKVFSCNKLYITNRRVIQYIMISPVVTSKNVIDLASIEDASFHQNSIIQKIFGMGTFRLATVGDETTYTLQYVELIDADDLNSITKLIRTNKKSNKEEE